ncbi:MAG: ABC transporter permease [Nocardioidaceae bacterium]
MTSEQVEEPHPLGPLKSPGQAGGLVDVFRRRYLLGLLTRKELRVRYQGSFVGLAWSYVQPGVRFAVYYYVVGLIMVGRSEDRGLQIFCGLIMVSFFTTALSAGTRSVVKNKSLVRKINMPREMFPVASIAVSLYHMFPMYVVLFIAAFLSGWHPDPLAFPAMVMAFVIVVLFGLGVALLLGAANVFFRDMQNVVDVVNTVIRWCVPMIYPFSIIKDRLLGTHDIIYQIYLANPLATSVVLNHRAFLTPSADDPQKAAAMEMPAHVFERGFIMIGVAILFVVIAQLVFSRLEGRFAEML